MKVEGYYQLGDPNKNRTRNAGWRVSYDGSIVGVGFDAIIPSNADRTYITTTKHEGAGRLCPDKDQVDQKIPPKPKVIEQTQLEDVYREFEGTILYKTCIADLLLINNTEAFGEIVSATLVTNVTAAKIGNILSEVN